MAYQSLYRRYRPRRFSDVRGQEQVIRALRNAVRDDRVGHAYMFSGPRGTGKTSTARILAKALNCENLQDGEPDGTCASCLSIDAGNSYDVQELDAASNNGVENVRDLVGRANLGSPGRTKVYILDEVHMLTAAASAALLKTLEEPPDHVVFVLATTDPHKVLPTIRSRTQHYEFNLLSADELAEHVAWVIHDAGLELDASVIDPVVRAGAGSARDTLSALDRMAAAGGVFESSDTVTDLMDAIAAADAGRAVVAVSEAMGAGRDARVLGEELLARLRDVFLLRMGASTDHMPAGDLERVRVWADQLGDRATTRALEAVGDALLEMRQAPDPRIPLEVAVVKLTRSEGDASLESLLDRVARLEAALAELAARAGTAPASGTASPSPAPSTPGASAQGAASPGPPRGGTAATPRSSSNPAPAGAASATGPASERPARPADAARAELAARRAQKSGSAAGSTPKRAPAASQPAPAPPEPAPPAPPEPAPPAPPEPAPPAPPAGGPLAATAAPAMSEPAVEATAAAAKPPSEPAASPQPGESPSADGAAVSRTDAAASGETTPRSGGLTAEQVEEIWADLPGVSGLTKGMFAAGTVAAVEGDVVVVSVPNDVHRQKCEQKKPDVEAALAAALGVAVTLRLIVDGDPGSGESGGGSSGSARPSNQPNGPSTGPGAGATDEFEDLGVDDVHDLADAPDAAVGGVDALTEAFPGSTFVEGS